jgi:transcriptional regulator with XRE-family HTH domain
MADADNRRVDDLSVGRLITLARQRRQWRQVDLAVSAGVSQQLVALAESGAMDRLTLRSLRGIAKPLGMRVVLTAVLNGGDADRLRDRDHASLVERITSMLRRHEWEVIVEYTFSHYGERGSIDIVAWHGDAHALLVIEVKTRIYDVQALLAGLDRKARVAGRLLAEERGWTPSTVGRVTVVPELSANRSVAERHASLFRAALPARSREVRTWLRRPAGALAGLWFLSSTNEVGGIRVAVGRQRVRVRGQARRGGQVTRSTSRVGE